MTDQNQDQGPPKEPLDPAIREQLRQAGETARERDTARAELAAAKRELAFQKAGIDTETGVGRLLAKAFDGEPTPEAVRAFAAENGVTPGQQAPAAQPGLDAMRRIVEAGQGAPPPPAGRDLQEALQSAKSPEEVMAIVGSMPRDTWTHRD